MPRFSYPICLLVLLLGVLLAPVRAQQLPTYAWVWTGGSSPAALPVSGNCLAVDSAGNSYTAGSFFGTAIFETQTFVAQSQQYGDMYLAKHSAQGRLLWVKQLGGPQVKSATDIAVDAAGNLYVTGHFWGALTLGSTTLIAGNSSYYYDTFLAKFTPQGTVLWAKQSTSAKWSSATGGSLAIDKGGNVYLAGHLYGQVQFDQFSFTISSNGSENFLAYYTSQGVLQWVRTGFGNGGISLATSPDGSLYLAASFSSSFTLGSYTLPPPPLFRFGLYLAKLDAQLNSLWVRYGFTDDSYLMSPVCHGLAIDPTSRGVVFSLTFGGPTTFGGRTFNCVGGCFPDSAGKNTGSDALILKYDAQGRFVWSQQVGGPLSAGGGGANSFVTQATDLAGKPALDAQGNSYVLLSLFGMPTLTTSVPSSSKWYSHLVSYTRTGAMRWTRPLDTAPLGSGSALSGAPSSVVWSATGYLYSTGYTQGPAQFDNLTVPLTGLYNAYTAKLRIPASADLEPALAAPNIITPNGDGLNETFRLPDLPEGPWQLRIYSRWGRLVYQTDDYRQDWNAPGQPDGLYYYYLQSPSRPLTSKGWVEVLH